MNQCKKAYKPVGLRLIVETEVQSVIVEALARSSYYPSRTLAAAGEIHECEDLVAVMRLLDERNLTDALYDGLIDLERPAAEEVLTEMESRS